MKQIVRACRLFIASGIVFLTLLTPIIVAAAEEISLQQTQKPVYCGDATNLLNFITKKHKESPIVIFSGGNGVEHQIVVFVNINTGTVSVVENHSGGIGGLIAFGTDVMVVPLKEKEAPALDYF